MRSVSAGVVLSQRRTQLTGIELAMGCDSDPEIGWVGLYRVYCRDTRSTIHWQISNGCWPEPVMVVE